MGKPITNAGCACWETLGYDEELDRRMKGPVQAGADTIAGAMVESCSKCQPLMIVRPHIR
jgi:hypothetical protein